MAALPWLAVRLQCVVWDIPGRSGLARGFQALNINLCYDHFISTCLALKQFHLLVRNVHRDNGFPGAALYVIWSFNLLYLN